MEESYFGSIFFLSLTSGVWGGAIWGGPFGWKKSTLARASCINFVKKLNLYVRNCATFISIFQVRLSQLYDGISLFNTMAKDGANQGQTTQKIVKIEKEFSTRNPFPTRFHPWFGGCHGIEAISEPSQRRTVTHGLWSTIRAKAIFHPRTVFGG